MACIRVIPDSPSVSGSDRWAIIAGAKFAPATAALVLTTSLLLAACGGGGGGGSSAPAVTVTASPVPTATPSPSSNATANPTAFTCPTSDTASTMASARSGGEAAARHAVLRAGVVAPSATTMLAVNYNRTVMTASNLRLIAGRETAANATFVQSYDYPSLNTTQRLIAVPTATLTQSKTLLSEQSGVQSIAVAGGHRFRMSASSAPSNDPYFAGFSGTTAPYHETTSIPGEWDLYAIGLDKAFGYASTTTNTAGIANGSALGSSTIKIAIIDTGEDTHHPELASKITYQKCFITNEAGTAQSTSNFTSDEDGHGTDVSGIAAADTGNGFGFAGVGGNAVIYGYRVFPTPDDSCSNENSTDPQCSSDTADIASAINDAVAQGVNIISMSLGGSTCTSTGVDSDPTEGAAVANAIAKNIIVVAASGNSGTTTSGVSAPGCDTGVIAVGATALDDGGPTGTTGSYTTTNVSAASATAPVEYVASYSQSASGSSWGIVAPGGDPSTADESGSTTDDLHWIEQIWTTTPFGGQGDANFAGQCAGDYPSDGGTVDCRTLIAGTSMATPHVAGAAALLLAVDPGLQSPTAMKSFLCQYADNLGDSHQGCGRLNIYRAMAHALGDSSVQ
jgi:Subtilase family